MRPLDKIKHFRKTLYDKVGFLDISNSIQGDDTLFLQLCLKNKIRKDLQLFDNSFVTSRNEENFISFIKELNYLKQPI